MGRGPTDSFEEQEEDKENSPRVSFRENPKNSRRRRIRLSPEAPEAPNSPGNGPDSPATDLVDVLLGRHGYSPPPVENSKSENSESENSESENSEFSEGSEDSEDSEDVSESEYSDYSENSENSEDLESVRSPNPDYLLSDAGPLSEAMEISESEEDDIYQISDSEVMDMEEDVEMDSEDSEDDSDDVTEGGSQMEIRSTSGIGGQIGHFDFMELVKDIGQEEIGNGRKFKISGEALNILQMESELMLIDLFKSANDVAKMGNRETLKVTDIQTAREMESAMKNKQT